MSYPQVRMTREAAGKYYRWQTRSGVLFMLVGGIGVLSTSGAFGWSCFMMYGGMFLGMGVAMKQFVVIEEGDEEDAFEIGQRVGDSR